MTSPHPAHQWRVCDVCMQRQDMSARVSPRALRWALLVTAAVAVALLVMPYSWLLHVVRAATTLGLLGLAVGFVVAVCTALMRAAIGSGGRSD